MISHYATIQVRRKTLMRQIEDLQCRWIASRLLSSTVVLLIILSCGCWAPFRSPGIPACELPEEFRAPIRTGGPPLNFSSLTISQPDDYLIGANDVLAVTIQELSEGALPQTISATVMADGNIQLPMVGPIQVGGKNLIAAQKEINDRYADGIIREPQISLAIESKATISVLVLGQVNQPGVYYLPRYENDVGHALASAGGITADAADYIEVHHKTNQILERNQSDFLQAVPKFSHASQSLPTSVAARITVPSESESGDLTSPSNVQLVQYQEWDDSAPSNGNVAGATQWESTSTVSHETESFGGPPEIKREPTLDPYFRTAQLHDVPREKPVRMARKIDIAPPVRPSTPQVNDANKSLIHNAAWPASPSSTPINETVQPNISNQLRSQTNITKIPLRGIGATQVSESDIVLQPGDVVVVPNRKHEVFYVVGRLSQTNTVRFTVGDRERELGVGFILPRDREIDVVTAVAMAGYIDPIESPTTVTVQRSMPNGQPMLIRVDLIAARSDPQQTVLVQPGDIIYLNPDAPWWWRKTLDRIVPDLLLEPYFKAIGR